jgi:hypothetical protein
MDALDKVIVLERGPLAPLQSAMAKLAAAGSTLGKLEGAWVFLSMESSSLQSRAYARKLQESANRIKTIASTSTPRADTANVPVIACTGVVD